jgi:uncharacterized repeat protein (TIGR01451 family)
MVQLRKLGRRGCPGRRAFTPLSKATATATRAAPPWPRRLWPDWPRWSSPPSAMPTAMAASTTRSAPGSSPPAMTSVSGIGAGRINAARAVGARRCRAGAGCRSCSCSRSCLGFEADDVITYTYTVTNTGEVDLTGIVVTDSRLGNVTLGATSLTTAASTSGTATYTVTQADIDSGADIVNTATVTCNQGVTDTDSATVMVEVPAVPAVYVSPSNQTGSGLARRERHLRVHRAEHRRRGGHL